MIQICRYVPEATERHDPRWPRRRCKEATDGLIRIYDLPALHQTIRRLRNKKRKWRVSGLGARDVYHRRKKHHQAHSYAPQPYNHDSEFRVIKDDYYNRS